MEDNNLLAEIQEDQRRFKEGKKKRKTKDEVKAEKDKKRKALKKKILTWLVITVLAVIGVAYCAERYVDWRAEHQWQFPIKWIGLVREIEPEGTETVAVKIPEMVEEKQSWTGKVSYYANGSGCLGCSANEIMANGQKFDENAMTLAFNKLPLNTKVRVINLDNGANIIATVTDTGGFEQYGRIADLSKGLMTELNAVTDVSNIKIEVL